MLRQERIERTKEQIREALQAYSAHTYDTDAMDNVQDAFVERLAEDSVDAKADLRNILSKSPAWNEDLDCLVINGNRTHEPDYRIVNKYAWEILGNAFDIADSDMKNNIAAAIRFFMNDEESKQISIDAINEIAPRAYAPGKKLSKVFMAICKALNIEENREFNQNYAILADELSARKIDFKLYLSINPAHFLTMSNPKDDKRGPSLTSCHSFNGGEYANGCAGYARDNVTMIAFTVADDNKPDSQYNRKTSRQLFMYQVNNGLLLQSRFYNSQAYGGTEGDQPESKLYRELVQKELADAENAPNLWNTCTYCGNSHSVEIEVGEGFGGYPDWPIARFAAKMSIRKDHADDYEAFSVGTYGLCIECGEETDENDLYCDEHGGTVCDECGERHNEDDMYRVYNADGYEVWVCESCRDEYYSYCEHCDELHHYDHMTWIENEERYVCDDCLDRHYTQCDECGEWTLNDYSTAVYDENGNYVDVCDDCLQNSYSYCEHCDEYHHNDRMNFNVHRHGREIDVCDDCLEADFAPCEECGEYFHNDDLDENGRCEDCHEDEEAC